MFAMVYVEAQEHRTRSDRLPKILLTRVNSERIIGLECKHGGGDEMALLVMVLGRGVAILCALAAYNFWNLEPKGVGNYFSCLVACLSAAVCWTLPTIFYENERKRDE